MIKFSTGQGMVTKMNEKEGGKSISELSDEMRMTCAVYHKVDFSIRVAGGLLSFMGAARTLNQSVLMNTNPF